MRRQHAQRRVQLGARGHRHLPALRHQFVHAQLRRRQPHQPGAAVAVGQQHHVAQPRARCVAPAHRQLFVLRLGLAVLVGAHRVEQAKADVFALRHDLQRRQALVDLDEARGLALPGDEGVAHQGRRGLHQVEHRAVAVVLAPHARAASRRRASARSLRLTSVASDTALGLPRPRAPAFCSSGSIATDAAVGAGRRPPRSGGPATSADALRVASAAAPPSARIEASASRQLSCAAPTKNGRAGVGRGRRFAQQRGRGAARQPRQPGHAGFVVFFAPARCACARSSAGFGHLDAQPGGQQQVVQVLQRLHARALAAAPGGSAHAPWARRPAAGRWHRPRRPRTQGIGVALAGFGGDELARLGSRRGRGCVAAAPSRRSSRSTARPGSCAGPFDGADRLPGGFEGGDAGVVAAVGDVEPRHAAPGPRCRRPPTMRAGLGAVAARISRSASRWRSRSCSASGPASLAPAATATAARWWLRSRRHGRRARCRRGRRSSGSMRATARGRRAAAAPAQLGLSTRVAA